MSYATWTSLFHKSKTLTIVDKPALEYQMPARRFRRRIGRKRNVRRKIKRAQRKMQAKGLHFFKLSGTFTMSSSVAGVNSDVLSMTNPGAYLNGASALPDLSNLTQLFDNYRIFGIKLKYTPFLQYGSNSNVPFYIVKDFDDETALSSVSQAVQYENHKVKMSNRPWKYYCKVPKIGSTTANTYGYGWFDLATAPNQAGLKFYCSNMTNTTNYGTMDVTYYIGFKLRR